MRSTGADVAEADVLVELPAHFLGERPDFLTVEIILDFGVVGCVVLERNEQHIQTGLLHREVPAEHGIVVVRRNVVPTKVLACVAVCTVLGLPLSGVVVGIVVIKKMTERGLAVVVQHGHVVAEARLDPVTSVDVALGEGEGGGILSDDIIPLLRLEHDLDMKMGAGGMSGLTNLADVVTHLHLVTFHQVFG